MSNVKVSKTQLTKSWNTRSYKVNNNEWKFGSWLKAFCKGFGLLLTYEIIEELIEEAIAYTITTVIAKAVSFLLVVFLTQSIKIGAKGLAKGITIALKPLVKKLTYKEGNDKVNKILRFINMCKEKINDNKFLNWLKNNPKSILGIVSGFIASLSGGAITVGGLYFGNVQLPLWAIIVIGCVVFGALFALVALGVTGAGFESPVKKMLRQFAVKLGFGEAVTALEKTYAQYEAEQEAKAEAERVALEQAQAKYKEEWRVAILNGRFDGSLEEYIAKKAQEEAEAQARLEEAQREQALAKAKVEWRNAVANGEYTGSFVDWQAENK